MTESFEFEYDGKLFEVEYEVRNDSFDHEYGVHREFNPYLVSAKKDGRELLTDELKYYGRILEDVMTKHFEQKEPRTN